MVSSRVTSVQTPANSNKIKLYSNERHVELVSLAMLLFLLHLVDLHARSWARRHLAAGLHLRSIWSVGAAGGLLLVHDQLASDNVWTQTFAIVVGTDTGIGNGEQDEDDGERGESSELLAGWFVGSRESALVHSHKLEYKIGQAAKVEDLRLLARSSIVAQIGQLTMTAMVPERISRRQKKPAKSRMMMVTGMAAIVR